MVQFEIFGTLIGALSLIVLSQVSCSPDHGTNQKTAIIYFEAFYISRIMVAWRVRILSGAAEDRFEMSSG